MRIQDGYGKTPKTKIKHAVYLDKSVNIVDSLPDLTDQAPRGAPAKGVNDFTQSLENGAVDVDGEKNRRPSEHFADRLKIVFEADLEVLVEDEVLFVVRV